MVGRVVVVFVVGSVVVVGRVVVVGVVTGVEGAMVLVAE